MSRNGEDWAWVNSTICSEAEQIRILMGDWGWIIWAWSKHLQFDLVQIDSSKKHRDLNLTLNISFHLLPWKHIKKNNSLLLPFSYHLFSSSYFSLALIHQELIHIVASSILDHCSHHLSPVLLLYGVAISIKRQLKQVCLQPQQAQREGYMFFWYMSENEWLVKPFHLFVSIFTGRIKQVHEAVFCWRPLDCLASDYLLWLAGC